MNSVISHIDYLLTRQYYVFVPGSGGFVIQHQSALFDKFVTICTPHRDISFNLGINHNDVLFAGSIFEDYALSYNDSLSFISVFVLSL